MMPGYFKSESQHRGVGVIIFFPDLLRPQIVIPGLEMFKFTFIILLHTKCLAQENFITNKIDIIAKKSKLNLNPAQLYTFTRKTQK